MITLFKNTKLKNIAKIFSGNSINEKIKEKNYIGIENGVDYISTKDISFDYSINYNNGIKIPFSKIESFKTAPKNTVFICAEGGSAGRKIAISDRELCFVNKLFAIVASDKVIPKYIFYSIISQDFFTQFKTQATGIIGGVSINKFKELEISLPPLPIQQKIVEKLDAIFAEIDKATVAVETNANNVEALFQSYLRQVFQNVDKDWRVAELSSVCDVFADGDWIETKDQSESGVRLIQTGNVGFGKFKFRDSKARYVSEETFKRLRCTEIKQGDILVSRLPDPVGRACMIPVLDVKSITAVDCTIIRTKKEIISTEFFNYFCQSPKYFEQVKKNITGATRQRISRSLLGKIVIPIPPLATQLKIVSKLIAISNELEKSSKSYADKISELTTLKQSILQQAFNSGLVKAA